MTETTEITADLDGVVRCFTEAINSKGAIEVGTAIILALGKLEHNPSLVDIHAGLVRALLSCYMTTTVPVDAQESLVTFGAILLKLGQAKPVMINPNVTGNN